MQLTETARVRLLIDGKEAVSELTMLEKKFDDINEAKKKFARSSNEFKELNAESKELAKSIALVRERMDVANMTTKEAARYQKDLILAFKDLKKGTEDYALASKKLTEVNTHLASLRRDMNAVSDTAVKSGGVWTNLKGWIVGAFAITAVVEFAKRLVDVGLGVFNITAKFEKYETVLKNALGSQIKATAAMEMLKNVAATTPFSLDEMTDGFNKMVQRGIIPTSTEIKKLTDLAASQGKEFGQLVEAVLDAQMGEGERLKEFGVKMRKSGDDISLSFKGQTTTVKNSEKAIYDAIIAMGAYNGVAGVTTEVSDKLAGKQSNLGDKIDFLAVTLGNKLKPIFHFILDLFIKGVEVVGQFIDLSAPLGYLFDAVAETLTGLWNIGKEVFYKLFPSAQNQVYDMSTHIKIFSSVLYGLLVPFQLLRALVVGAIDSFRVFGNATGMVWKALKGDFEGAKADAKSLEVSWTALKKNGSENFGAITAGIKKIWSENQKDIKQDSKSWDEWAKELKANQKEVTNDVDGNAKEREKAYKKEAAERLKAHKDMLQAIEKANELADKTLRKSLQDQVKSLKSNNTEELKAREKLDDEIRDNALKMASFKDAAMKLERIKLATSVEEIEAIEKEYLEKSLKRELESAKEKLAIKEREYKMLKAMGMLYKEEDDKRSAEILRLKNEVSEKEVAIVKQGVAEKTKITKESEKASEDATKAYNQRRKDALKQQMDYETMAWEMFGKSLKDISEEQYEALEASAEKKKQLAESMANAIVDATEEIFSFFSEKISDQLDKADNEVEKFLAEQSQKDAKYAQGMMKGVVKAASGDLAGGLLAIGTSLSQWVYGQITYASNLAEAHAKMQIERMTKNMEVLTGKITEVSGKLTSVSEIYGKMGEVNPFEGVGLASVKLGEIYDSLLVIVPKVGELAERGEKSGLSLIESEIKIGEQIVSNYNLAIAREEQLNQEILSNIQDQYNEAVAAINKKYDLESTRAAGAFAADSLGIMQSTNAALMAFVTVEDTKTSLMADYNKRRSDITAIYADKIRPITAEMSEAEVAGIQAATKARDEAYAGVEAWLTKELQFVLGNEEQKRESFTATQKIINDGEYATDLLREEYKANEIDRNTQRDLELLAAFDKFNADKAAAEKRHKDEMVALQKEYEDALNASYERLKNNMVTAIDQMQARYTAMIAAGVADTGELFTAIQNLRAQYESLFGAMNTPVRTDFTNNPDNNTPTRTNVPRFEDGGILKASDYFENHGVLGGLSHNTPEGGNWVVNARTGRIQAKVEAGEWMGIINKKTTARYKNLLSYLANSSVATTGKPVYAENGYFGTPTPVDGSVKSFTSTTTSIPVFEGFGELIGLMREFIAKVEMSNELLGAVAVSSDEAAKKSLVISVNNILDAADIVADVDRRSSFS